MSFILIYVIDSTEYDNKNKNNNRNRTKTDRLKILVAVWTT